MLHNLILFAIINSVTSTLWLNEVASQMQLKDEDNHNEDEFEFTNTFAVEMDGDKIVAELVAGIYGFDVKDLRYLSGVYLFTHDGTPKRAKRSADHIVSELENDPHVYRVEQQRSLRRRKRRPYDDKFSDAISAIYDKVSREISSRHHSGRPYNTSSADPVFNDPQYTGQWYLTPSNGSGGADGRSDVNVGVVWTSGFTGQDVVITVLDDGIEYTHTDLARNYDPDASTDLNDDDDDPLPNSRVAGNDHGTLCAGVIAAVSNNGKCGVGVAYNSKIGGVRVLDGVVTDVLESQALRFGLGHVDIYSASWGPTDNGKTMEAPGYFASKSLQLGITKGRNGKGSLYVWASGNGGKFDDTCNADGYVSSIYTIAIGSITAQGASNYYEEPCSSKMAVVYTGGTTDPTPELPPGDVVSTGLFNKCTQTFAGTSSAAPVLAGCLALVLEANANITWRDAQHLIVRSARLTNADQLVWSKNGAGLHVSHQFGFGVVDCGRMVQLSQNWTTVAPQHVCFVNDAGIHRNIARAATLVLTLNTDGCQDTDDVIDTLEHVEARVMLNHTSRGQVELVVVSPAGTKSTILKTRQLDKSTTINFTFMSVHFWGEQPNGVWSLLVSDKPDSGAVNSGVVYYWSLTLYGTSASGSGVRRSVNQAAPESRVMTRSDLKVTYSRETRRTEEVNIRPKPAADVIPSFASDVRKPADSDISKPADVIPSSASDVRKPADSDISKPADVIPSADSDVHKPADSDISKPSDVRKPADSDVTASVGHDVNKHDLDGGKHNVDSDINVWFGHLTEAGDTGRDRSKNRPSWLDTKPESAAGDTTNDERKSGAVDKKMEDFSESDKTFLLQMIKQLEDEQKSS